MAKQATRQLPRNFGDCEPHEQRAWFERRDRELAEPNPYLKNQDGIKILNMAAKTAIAAEAEAMITADGWDLETTKARRIEWNVAIKAGEATGRNGKVDARKLAALQRRLGWTMDALKIAVNMHGL